MKHLLRRFLFLAILLSALGTTVTSVSAGSALTEDEYWKLVQNTRAAVKKLEGSTPEQIKQGLAPLAAAWKNSVQVDVDGQVITVDNQYLYTALSADEPDLERVAGILDALLAAHEKFPNKVFSSADLKSLSAILSRPEFQWAEEAPNPVNNWLQKLWDSIFRWLNKILGNGFSIPGGDLLFSVIVSIVLTLILFYVFRTLIVDFVKEARIDSDEDEAGEPLTSDAAFQKAQTLSRGGDFRSAVRYLYLSSLLLMDERGVLRYDRSKTNREYLRSVANSPELAKPLEEVIEVFDNVWYGYHTLEEETFKHYSDRVEELKEKKS